MAVLNPRMKDSKSFSLSIHLGPAAEVAIRIGRPAKFSHPATGGVVDAHVKCSEIIKDCALVHLEDSAPFRAESLPESAAGE
jgi:hypothetical protein